MLPGFRFLFAAIVLSMSVLVFGLGAAAMLRAAHEQFAESGSWRPALETPVAQQSEMTRPVLAMLRVDPPAASAPQAAAPAPPAEIASPPPAAEKSAAQDQQTPSLPETGNTEAGNTDAATTEIAKAEVAPEMPKAEDRAVQTAVAAPVPAPQEPGQLEAPAAQPAAAVEAPAAVDTKTAAAPPAAPIAAPAVSAPPAADEPTASSENAPAPAAPEQASAPTAADPATARIATLGDPPAATGEPPPDYTVRADPGEAKKREKERAEERARQRRRLAAQRARLAREAAAQQAAYPFGRTNQVPQFLQPGVQRARARAD